MIAKVWIIIISIIVLFSVWLLAIKKRLKKLEDSLDSSEKERKAILDFVSKMGEKVSNIVDFEKTLESIADFIVDYTQAEAGAIFLFNEDKTSLSAKVVHGMFPPLHSVPGYILTKKKYLQERLKHEKIKMGEGVLSEVAQTGRVMVINNAQNDPRIPKLTTNFITINSLILVPLKVRYEILGVFGLLNKRGNQVFTESDTSILQSLADLAAVITDMVKLYHDSTEKERLEQELKIAQEFQNVLLPRHCPVIEGVEIASYFNPALEIGGDYFDYIKVDNSQLGVVIADVSGKGIPGALVMTMVRTILRSDAIGISSPKEVLKRINEKIYKDTKESVFITMNYVVIDFKNMKLRYARAGHEPLIMINVESNQPYLSIPKGIALGLVVGETFDIMEEVELDIKRNDILVFYTDGVIEARDTNELEFGQDRFINILQANVDKSPELIIETIMKEINKFTEGIPQHDDITLVVMKFKEVITIKNDLTIENVQGI